MRKIGVVFSSLFQSTSPRGGRLIPSPAVSICARFQSTSPRGGRLRPSRHGPQRAAYFNPRPREGDDYPLPVSVQAPGISIHVPARGTTSTRPQPEPLRWISIHVPARGTTRFLIPLSFRLNFNPRPREGDDFVTFVNSFLLTLFQSTSPRGGRRCRHRRYGPSCRFQSTSPRGGRRRRRGQRDRNRPDFNPRPREGDDLRPLPGSSWKRRFQSTSPRGGRPSRPRRLKTGYSISIHVPARGTTLKGFLLRADLAEISIHVPARGTTVLQAQYNISKVYFNPRPREGDDRCRHRRYGPSCRFQSTSPRGGRPISKARFTPPK